MALHRYTTIIPNWNSGPIKQQLSILSPQALAITTLLFVSGNFIPLRYLIWLRSHSICPFKNNLHLNVFSTVNIYHVLSLPPPWGRQGRNYWSGFGGPGSGGSGRFRDLSKPTAHKIPGLSDAHTLLRGWYRIWMHLDRWRATTTTLSPHQATFLCPQDWFEHFTADWQSEQEIINAVGWS